MTRVIIKFEWGYEEPYDIEMTIIEGCDYELEIDLERKGSEVSGIAMWKYYCEFWNDEKNKFEYKKGKRTIKIPEDVAHMLFGLAVRHEAEKDEEKKREIREDLIDKFMDWFQTRLETVIAYPSPESVEIKLVEQR